MATHLYCSRGCRASTDHLGFPGSGEFKPIPTDLFQEYFRRERPSEPQKSPSTDPGTPGELTQGSLLRIWLKPPWDDYAGTGSERDSVLLGSTATAQPVLACHRKTYFSKASIRAFQSSGGVTVLQALSSIQHPNIAKLYDVYLYDDKIFVASEYLELSLAELNFHSFPFEEWEIAEQHEPHIYI